MDKLGGRTGSLVMFLAELIIGILLLINPTGFTSAIIIIAGIAMLAIGIYEIAKYFTSEPLEALTEQSLSIGLIISAIGLFCIINSNWFIETFPILCIVYGIVILLSGFVKIQKTVDSIRLHIGNWWIIGISAILSIIFAIIIIRNPFTTTAVLWKFTGIILIVEAILDIVSIALNKEN